MPLNYRKSPLNEEKTFTSLYHNSGIYNDVFYVSKQGDNTDGKSWLTAYNLPTTAIAEASEEDGDNTAILMLPGDYDINTSGIYEIDRNIDIVGSHRGEVRLLNNHSSATGIFKATDQCGFHNLRFCAGTGSHSVGSLNINGSDAQSSHIESCKFSSMQATGTTTSLLLDGGVPGVEICKCNFRGSAAHTTAIKLNNASRVFFEDIRVLVSNTAVHLAHASNDNVFMHDSILDSSAVGLKMDAGNDYHFLDTYFTHNTTNVVVDSSVTLISFVDSKFEDLNTSLVPSNLTGIAIAGGGAANTYGALTEIRASASATVPFFVLGLIFEASTKEKFGLKLTSDGGTTYFWEGIFEGVLNDAIRVVLTEPHQVSAYSKIEAQLKSESGGDSGLLWVKIQEV